VASDTTMGTKAVAETQPNLIQRTRDYIEQLRAEMRKVTWPGRKQVQATTLVVIACVFLFALFFAVVDLAVGRGINYLIENLTK
jgi:preprotein translocase subunit SecE